MRPDGASHLSEVPPAEPLESSHGGAFGARIVRPQPVEDITYRICRGSGSHRPDRQPVTAPFEAEVTSFAYFASTPLA
jgi:hypothetical protein